MNEDFIDEEKAWQKEMTARNIEKELLEAMSLVDLEIFIPQQLQIVLDNIKMIKEEKNRRLEVVFKNTKKGSFDEYFNVSVITYEFAKYYEMQKRMSFWLNLWYKIMPQSLPVKLQNKIQSLSEEDIARAKQSPIEDHYEGRLRKVGSRFTGLCPFHQEKTPSFYIFSDNHWHCFGACGEGGDVIKFVMKTKKLTFPEAVRYLL